jgi:hypothetical protein
LEAAVMHGTTVNLAEMAKDAFYLRWVDADWGLG